MHSAYPHVVVVVFVVGVIVVVLVAVFVVIQESVHTHMSVEEDRCIFMEAAIVRIMKAR